MRTLKVRSIAAIAVALAVVGAVQLTAPAAPAEAAVSRIDGTDRFQVSARISERMGTTTGGVVFLVSGTRFPDALAAGPVAAAEDAHMLLTAPDRIPDSIDQRIRALAPSEIVLVGGDASISQAVVTRANQLAPTVTRIAGADRVANSFLLLDRMLANQSTPTRVWVVSGGSFADALSAGAVAARYGHGLVLTTGASQGFQTEVANRLAGISAFSIAGGTASVSSATESWLRGQRTTERLGGANRYEVAVNVNARYTTSADRSTMLLASGAGFADGLGAAVLSAAIGAPLYLTPPTCRGTTRVADEVRRLGIRDTLVVGGPRSVSDNAANLRECPPNVPAIQAQVIQIVNQERARVGAPPLTASSGLQSMATRWSFWMAHTQSMVHSQTFCTETFEMGFRRCAENIARTGSPSAENVMDLWMDSTGHRNNILNPNLTHIGVGLVQGDDGRWYWTQNFGGY